MEKRNYVKPIIIGNKVVTQNFFVTSGGNGSGGSTGNSSIAINIIEECFRIDEDGAGVGSNINDTNFEKYLICEKPDGIILKCDKDYNDNGISITIDECYLVKLTGSGSGSTATRNWTFTKAACSGLTNPDFSGRVVITYGDLTNNCNL